MQSPTPEERKIMKRIKKPICYWCEFCPTESYRDKIFCSNARDWKAACKTGMCLGFQHKDKEQAAPQAGQLELF